MPKVNDNIFEDNSLTTDPMYKIKSIEPLYLSCRVRSWETYDLRCRFLGSIITEYGSIKRFGDSKG